MNFSFTCKTAYEACAYLAKSLATRRRQLSRIDDVKIFAKRQHIRHIFSAGLRLCPCQKFVCGVLEGETREIAISDPLVDLTDKVEVLLKMGRCCQWSPCRGKCDPKELDDLEVPRNLLSDWVWIRKAQIFSGSEIPQ